MRVYRGISHRNEDLAPLPEVSVNISLWAKVAAEKGRDQLVTLKLCCGGNQPKSILNKKAQETIQEGR